MTRTSGCLMTNPTALSAIPGFVGCFTECQYVWNICIYVVYCIHFLNEETHYINMWLAQAMHLRMSPVSMGSAPLQLGYVTRTTVTTVTVNPNIFYSNMERGVHKCLKTCTYTHTH